MITVTKKYLNPLILLLVLLPFSNAYAEKSPAFKTLEVDGATLQYLDEGTGEPVIFVHGAFSDMRAWLEMHEALSKHYRVISYTRRFYGTNPITQGEQQYDHGVHAEDLLALIRTVGAGPAHLVTWSSGAYSASIVASEYPNLVKSIVHFEPITTSAMMKDVPHYQSASNEWDLRWDGVIEQLDSGDLRHAMRKAIELVFELPAGGFDSLPASFKTMFLDNAHSIPVMFSGETAIKTDCAYVGKITQPTLVILGTLTHRAFAMEVERMHECMPNSKMEVIAGVNHAGPLQDKKAILELIKTHIQAYQ